MSESVRCVDRDKPCEINSLAHLIGKASQDEQTMTQAHIAGVPDARDTSKFQNLNSNYDQHYNTPHARSVAAGSGKAPEKTTHTEDVTWSWKKHLRQQGASL